MYIRLFEVWSIVLWFRKIIIVIYKSCIIYIIHFRCKKVLQVTKQG